MSERARRVGMNESLFRTVNDEVRNVSERFSVTAQTMSVVCECERTDCHEQIELGPDEYERVRSEPTFFIVKPEHDAPDVESVVERHETYWVVRKHEGEPADIARRTDGLN